MLLASHNSWSYLRPKKWWMRLLRFTSRCQDVGIREQYEIYGVRCFDLRLSFNGDGILQVNHGYIVYDITVDSLMSQLGWLNRKGDVAVRVLLDVRNKRHYTLLNRKCFSSCCITLSQLFPHIRFWCGRNLYNWDMEYSFDYEPTCDEKYASVCSPKLLDDWYPRWFAKKHTRKLYKAGSICDYLMLDFVNYTK